MDITHRTTVPDGELQVRTYPDPGGDMGPWADIELDAERRSYYLSVTSLADADRLLKAVTLARAHLAAGEGEGRVNGQPETPGQRALARARANAQDTLSRYAADLARWAADREHAGAYWAGALAQALEQLLSATAAEGDAR